MTPAKYIDAKRNKGKLLVDNEHHQYNLAKRGEKKTWWICSRKSEIGCKVTATVLVRKNEDDVDKIIEIRGTHEHDSDLVKKAAMAVVQNHVNKAATDLHIKPRNVLANITSELQNKEATKEAVSFLPKRKTITKQIDRARRNEMQVPNPPKNWMEVVVPEPLKRTDSGENFLILEVNAEEHRPEKLLGFASPESINIMKSCTQMFADGTFSVVEKTPFFQLLVIISSTPNGINLPTAFFLLPTKEALCYKKCLECLKNLGITDPPILHCDYEKAIIKSVNQVFPTTRIICCDTHFKRCITTNIQKHHLQAARNSDIRLQQLVRYMWALSLVPVSDIVKVWEQFVVKKVPVIAEDEWPNVEPDDLEDFVDYFEKTWVGGINKRSGNRKHPKFNHNLWNKHQAIVNEEDLTTNSSEGYNHQLRLSIPKNSNLWKLICHLIKEDSLNAWKIRDAITQSTRHGGAGDDHATVSPSTNARSAERLRRREELKNIVRQYQELPIKKWMNMIVAYYDN